MCPEEDDSVFGPSGILNSQPLPSARVYDGPIGVGGCGGGTKPKTEAEINAEKAALPRPGLVPPRAILAAGRAFAFGVAKHGLAKNGRGTYRVAGTEQAMVSTHFECLMRHLLLWQSGETHAPDSKLHHLDHAMAQLAIIVDLVEDPPK